VDTLDFRDKRNRRNIPTKQQNTQQQKHKGIHRVAYRPKSPVTNQVNHYEANHSNASKDKLFFPAIGPFAGLAGWTWFCGVANRIDSGYPDGDQSQRSSQQA
jgi:hypothetical protein